jgi:hypothetical protein
MAHDKCFIDAATTEIFSVLADTTPNDQWVVGANDIRAIDPILFQVGAYFHHTVRPERGDCAPPDEGCRRASVVSSNCREEHVIGGDCLPRGVMRVS